MHPPLVFWCVCNSCGGRMHTLEEKREKRKKLILYLGVFVMVVGQIPTLQKKQSPPFANVKDCCNFDEVSSRSQILAFLG
eukprot:c38353_g1_i1 orf=53-292(+)